MSQMSDYLENLLVNATLRGIPFTPPAAVYLALFTSDPTDAKTGVEVTGGSYVRKAIVFGAPTNGVTANTADVIFDAATANWGTISHLAIFDAATAGNMLYYGPLVTAKVISTDDQLKVSAGDVTVTLQ